MRLARGTREIFDAESLVEEYVSERPARSAVRYAYPYYDGLETNGDPYVLCTADLLAPALLGVTMSLDRMHTLTRLVPLLQRGLDALPPGGDLAHADEQTLDRIAAVYDPLDDPDVDNPDVKGSIIAKVLHRKRPELLPLFDSKIQLFYQHEQAVPPTPRHGRTWREYMGLLVRCMQDDLRANADEFSRLIRLAPEGSPRLTPLRALDITVWMSSAV